MSATDKLIETCKLFERGIREATSELISAKLKVDGSSEEVIAKRLEELALFSAKRIILRASALSLSPEITEQPKSPDLIQEYGEVASDKVLEQCILKSIMQADAVKKIIQTPNSLLNKETIAMKEKVIKAITDHTEKENLLIAIDKGLKEKEAELVAVQSEWYERMREMRALRDSSMDEDMEDDQMDDELVNTKAKYLSKIRVLCSVVQRVATGQSNDYDWLSDPHGRLAIIKECRKCTYNL
ncbi:hypothetical protein K1T71_000740 [Dendrolimus kikuchii]|uniref:Uncharacterized protein n=1 Tax=Dendrolimus kikuchii TaxID=765133 RepID=A0ACC1DKT4_9NEOP|nr:hypothetical protein K1T71_000740 [Dendrolimus kikuchii]